MTSITRLALFTAALAAVFAVAVATGRAVGPDPKPASESPHGEDAAAPMGDGHGGHDAHADDATAGGHEAHGADAVRGLAVSEGGLTLALTERSARPGEAFDLGFRIVDEAGRAVRDYDVVHTKRMHLIVVRRDLTGFQHLHPALGADGVWRVRTTLPEPGTYRVFADFEADGEAHTLGDDLTVDGDVQTRALPQPALVADADGLSVRRAGGAAHAGRATALDFDLSRDGDTVRPAEYLGAKGHLVALREGDLAFLHVHPEEGRLRFDATFPSAGRYRLFLQVKEGDAIRTAAFTQEVGR